MLDASQRTTDRSKDMNEMKTTVVGNIVNVVSRKRLNDGTELASFRIAHNHRRLDRQTGEWTEVATTFISVTCWRRLGQNVLATFAKGDPVIVHGRLQTREYEKDGQTRLSVEMEAESVGPDLNRCTAAITRMRRDEARPAPGEDQDGSPQDAAERGGLVGLRPVTGMPDRSEPFDGYGVEPFDEAHERAGLDDLADLAEAGVPAGRS
jgi:single-strand DNA-binding protein